MGNYLTHTVGGTPPQGLDAYIGTAALAALLVDLSTTPLKQDAVDEAIEGAEGVIDSYLSVRYDTPVSPVPEVLEDMAAALAVERLYGRGKATPEDVRQRADRARQWLKDVSRGDAQLADSTLAAEATDASGVILSTTETRVMSRDNLDW